MTTAFQKCREEICIDSKIKKSTLEQLKSAFLHVDIRGHKRTTYKKTSPAPIALPLLRIKLYTCVSKLFFTLDLKAPYWKQECQQGNNPFLRSVLGPPMNPY